MRTTRSISELLQNNRPPDAPSEWTLDRYEVGELDGAEHDTLHARIQDEPALAAHMEKRRQKEAGWTATDTARLLEKIGPLEAEAPQPESLWSRFKAWWSDTSTVGLGLATAVGVFAGFFVIQDLAMGPTVRTKGSDPSITVFRERGGEVVQARYGDRFYPGDRLRFEVQLPQDSYLLVVGEEASGTLFTYFPVRDTQSRFIEEGRTVLPGAARLDGSTGEEWLHVVACESQVSLDQVAGGRGGLELPEDCLKSSFAMRKEAK